MSEVREWQIEKTKDGQAHVWGEATIGSFGQLVRVRVVDKISYHAVTAELDRAKSEIERLKSDEKTLKESARQYADRNFGGSEYSQKIFAFEAGAKWSIERDALARALDVAKRKLAAVMAGPEYQDWLTELERPERRRE